MPLAISLQSSFSLHFFAFVQLRVRGNESSSLSSSVLQSTKGQETGQRGEKWVQPGTANLKSRSPYPSSEAQVRAEGEQDTVSESRP